MPAPGHTVIYTHGGGRMGNQLLRFVHWLAWVRAHPGQVEVLNFAFWPFADCFAVWRAHPGCVFPLRSGRADRLARQRAALPRRLLAWEERRFRFARVVQAAGGWWPGAQAIALDVAREEAVDLDAAEFLARVVRRPVTFCSGWKIASWALVAAQQAELRPFFRPAPEFEQRAADFIAGLRRQHDVVIGLLIRQSDYRVWHEGRFYFSTERYVAWVRQLLDLHGGRRVAIVLTSESRQTLEPFAGLPVFLGTGAPSARGHSFENWVELSMCDLVVSPPSTFSATACFAGGVPLWPLTSARQDLAFDQILADGMVGAAAHPEFSCAVK